MDPNNPNNPNNPTDPLAGTPPSSPSDASTPDAVNFNSNPSVTPGPIAGPDSASTPASVPTPDTGNFDWSTTAPSPLQEPTTTALDSSSPAITPNTFPEPKINPVPPQDTYGALAGSTEGNDPQTQVAVSNNPDQNIPAPAFTSPVTDHTTSPGMNTGGFPDSFNNQTTPLTPSSPLEPSNQPPSAPSGFVPEETTTPNPFLTNTTDTTPSSPADSSALMSAIGAEAAPTDLSHLAGDINNAPNNTPVAPEVSAPETVIVPTAATSNQTTGQVVTSASRSFPKWLLIVAGVILLLVTAASAYLILGIGQNKPIAQSQTSIGQIPVNTPVEVVIPTVPPANAPTSPAGFGGFQGGNTISEATASPTPAGSSAFDRIRQRQP